MTSTSADRIAGVRQALLVLSLMGLAGCVTESLTICDDGIACPRDTVCARIVRPTGTEAFCASVAQVTACDGAGDGSPCVVADIPGSCDQGFCIAGCGDGQPGIGEEC